MLKTERLNQIEEMLHEYGKVEITDLCRIFNVTDMTIRRDLSDLVQKKIAVRSHGGAILAPNNILSERPYEIRITRNLTEKKAIAKKALPMIHNGDKVFFDSSTSAYCLAQQIPNSLHFVAVTDTLTTALELNARKNVKVICLGGEINKSTGSCTGVFAERTLSAMHFDTAFIGLPNVSMTGILSTESITELSIKKSIIANSEKAVALVDYSKLGKPDFLELGQLSDIDVLVTDSKMSTEFTDLCRSLGVEVIVAEVDSRRS